MPAEKIPARAIIFIVLVFLALVIVHLQWGTDREDPAESGEQGPRLSRIQIAEDDQPVDIDPESRLTRRELTELMEGRIHLLTSGQTNERRATAIQLAYMANDPGEQEKLLRLKPGLMKRLKEALLKGLHDPDKSVAKTCRESLVGLWRMSDSAAANQHFRKGLAALRAGRPDVALDTFNRIEEIGGPLPPDLHRMKAEIYLEKSVLEETLAECLYALQAEPENFMAFYVLGRAYAQQGDDENALKALNKALSICKALPEAELLRARILARQEETGS